MPFAHALNRHIQATKELAAVAQQVDAVAALLRDRLVDGAATLYIAGNGGSAADAQHIAAELMVRYSADRDPLRAVALTTDSSVLTACANDLDYSAVFSRQLWLARPGDVVLLISTSGTSTNILRAVRLCLARRITCIGLTGHGVSMGCDFNVAIACTETARIQECHQLIYHSWCEQLDP